MMSLVNSFLFSHQESFGWDPHSFVVGDDLHEFMPLDMESPVLSEASSGYLQDAVAGWRDRSKRRRILSTLRDQEAVEEGLQDLQQGFWDSNCHEDPLENLSIMIQDHNFVSDDPWSSFMSLKWSSTKEDASPKLQHQELLSSPSCSQGRDTHESGDSRPSPRSSTLRSLIPVLKDRKVERRRKKGTAVVYPFVVVKPGGLEGDVTLADINERILRRPTRPVRHPVGEFACGPCVFSTNSPGLSGKTVVGLMRIQTQGRGTVTIIRTRE